MTSGFDLPPVGSVIHNLMRMRGTWHDQVELFELDGRPLADDTTLGSGTPGASPFDVLAYVDFDGQVLKVTNVWFRGRPIGAKTFSGRIRDNLLVFDPLGPGAPEIVGMSGGPGILTFNNLAIDQSCSIYMEPDFILLLGASERLRHTVLYAGGVARRTLTARGVRLDPTCDRRHPIDPRGSDGPVHGPAYSTDVWAAIGT